MPAWIVCYPIFFSFCKGIQNPVQRRNNPRDYVEMWCTRKFCAHNQEKSRSCPKQMFGGVNTCRWCSPLIFLCLLHTHTPINTTTWWHKYKSGHFHCFIVDMNFPNIQTGKNIHWWRLVYKKYIYGENTLIFPWFHAWKCIDCLLWGTPSRAKIIRVNSMLFLHYISFRFSGYFFDYLSPLWFMGWNVVEQNSLDFAASAQALNMVPRPFTDSVLRTRGDCTSSRLFSVLEIILVSIPLRILKIRALETF